MGVELKPKLPEEIRAARDLLVVSRDELNSMISQREDYQRVIEEIRVRNAAIAALNWVLGGRREGMNREDSVACRRFGEELSNLERESSPEASYFGDRWITKGW